MSSLHNALRGAPHVSLAIRRMFGGDEMLDVERLGETLVPIVNVWDHSWCAHLRGEQLWSASSAGAATAAELTFVGIMNPADSGLIVTVDGASFRTPTAGELVAAGRSAAGVNLVTLADASAQVVPRDTRAGTVGRTLIARGASAATLLTGRILGRARNISANDTTQIPGAFPVILSPGFGVVIEHQTVNVVMEVNFWGSERTALSGELE